MRTILRPDVTGTVCGPAFSTTLASIFLAASLLLVAPQAALAQTTHTVCDEGCDFDAPEDAASSGLVLSGDTIDVFTGTYTLASTIVVDKSLTILANDSTFDANGLRAIDVSGGTTNFSLTNVTIRNGQATAGTGGGAFRISGGAVATVVNGTFEDNQAEFGGAVHNDGSTLYLSASVFSGNQATAGNGGAIFTDGDGTTDLSGSTVDGNLASSAGGGLATEGGARINVIQSTVSGNAALSPSIVIDNFTNSLSSNYCGAGPYGQTFIPGVGAISGFKYVISISGGAASDIAVSGRIREGGPLGPLLAAPTAIIPAGTLTSRYELTFALDQPVAVDPAATYAIELDIPGGAFSVYLILSPGPYTDGGSYHCGTTVSTNNFEFQILGGTPGDGGGAYSTGQVDPGNRSTIALTNSTLSGNVGDGGFATDGGEVSTFFSTVTNNSGNGLTAVPDQPDVAPQGLVFFTTSIIAGNVGNDCDGNNLNLTSSGFNLIGDDSNCPFYTGEGIDPASDQVGDGESPIDPLLGPLQFNGGRTFTHAIDETSPAFDAAGTSADTYCGALTTDQRGSGRPNGLDCDVGAFEFYLVGPLQTMIDAAQPGATIVVPDGTYNEAITLGDGKTLDGSSPDNVVIDGSGLNAPVITATGSFNLQGIRVTNGSSNGNGGGILASVPGVNITLSDVLLDNNHADGNGGAIFIQSGNLTGSDVTFTNNSASGNGGAIFNTLGLVSLLNVVIEDGNATLGGAIFNDVGSQLFIGNDEACSSAPADTSSPVPNLISNNTATGVGGAILANGTVVIGETRFTGNAALSGGAISGGNGSLAVDCSIFDSNGATNGSGGAIDSDNFAIDTSLFQDNAATDSGGALSGAFGTVSDSVFLLNDADVLGGAVFSDTPLTSNRNVFEDNQSNLGGAIATDFESSFPVGSTDDTFSGNRARIYGGAVLARDSDFTIDHGLFQDNSAGDGESNIAGRGGAIFSDQFVNIVESVFTENLVEDGSNEGGPEPGQGGAIFNSSTLEISDSTINNSTAGTGGGIYNNWVANALITGTTLLENDATGPGTVGGAIGGGGTIVLKNSTLSGNTTSGGGNGAGIGLVSGFAELNNVTLAYNASSGLGGPFYADSGEPGALIQFSNSLLSNNTGGGTNCNTVESLGFNLFQNAPCATDPSDIESEPLIALLAPNGGPTQTHALQGPSPAVNAGHPVPSFPQFDAGNFSQLQTQGAAALDGGTLFLADGTQHEGSAFVTNPINPSEDFSATFQFMITPGPSGAADGLTFTISDDPTVLGTGGGLLGIANYLPGGGATGVVSGVSVEFDTWVNGANEGANDADIDHIGININGNLSSIAIANLGSPGEHGILSDGNAWTAWIDYSTGNNLLEVRAANDSIRPVAPTVSATVDIASLTGPNAYVGFTAGAAVPGFGHLAGQHRILSFSFANSCEPTDQRGNLRPNGSACDIGAFEGITIPLQLGSVSLRAVMRGEELDDGSSYPGVVNVPIIDIPIEKLTGDTFNAPESAPLGSFPLGSFPIGSFDMQSSPLGSFPLGSFPLGSFPLGSFPLGSFPLSSIPLLSIGGWTEIIDSIPELAGSPPQGVTLEQLMTLDPVPGSVANIELRDLSILDSPLASLSLPGISLGGTSVELLDDWAQNADPAGAETVCAQLVSADSSFSDCEDTDTLLSLEAKGAPVSALSLSSLPLGSFPLGSFPLGSFPIGSFPLGSFPLGSFPLGSFPLGSFPLGSFPLGSFPLGSFPMGSFDLLAAPTESLPLGSFPIGSFPLGSFEIDGQSFCEFYDNEALGSGDKTCSELSINPTTDSLTDLVRALQTEADLLGDTTGGIASTPLGSFPMGSFPIGSFPIGSFPLGSFDLTAAPLSEVTLGHFGGCQAIDGTDDCSNTAALTADSSLLDVESEYGTLAASPLGSFPLGSFAIADLPMGSFPLGSFEINGTPLGSFPLGSFDLVSSPLGSFPLGSFASVISGPCPNCETLADAAKAGAIRSSATLADLAGSTQFDNTTLGVVLDAMTLAMIHGPGELRDIEDPGNLTLGQMLISMMLKTDFPWETISLDDLNPQEFSPDNFVEFEVDFELTGTEQEEVWVRVTMADSFLFEDGSATLDVVTTGGVQPQVSLPDPEVFLTGGNQILTFKLNLGGYTDNTVRFSAIPPLALGEYPTSAEIVFISGVIPGLSAERNGIHAVSGTAGSKKPRISALPGETPVTAAAQVVGADEGMLTVVPDPMTNASDSEEAITASTDELILGFIDSPSDNDYYLVAPPAAGDRVAVFMSNPAGDNDLIMYEPLSTVEAKGQLDEAPPLDSIPFEDDGVDYQGNLSEEPNALEDVNLAASPLASISTNRGTLDESVSAIAGNDEPFIIQVSGYNGARSEQPYTLRVKVTPQLQAPQCSARTWPNTVSPTVLPAGTWTAETNAVFLVNGSRLASSEPGTPLEAQTAADDALTAINNLIGAPGIIDGVVVDVADILDELAAPDYYGDWDANPCDVESPNKIVNAITQYLDEQRRFYSPKLAYVTIVGSDEVIPFARKPDETSIANESTFAGEFEDNAMYGALVTRHFLSDDTYGDIDPVAWLDRYLNVPELGVGRLVEAAADIQAAAENYVASAGILDPQTALSAGYDFIADASAEIDEAFRANSSLLGYDVQQALIDPAGITPKTDAWTRSDFLDATAVNTADPVDLVSFNMHFDFDEALPSIGDATKNPAAELIHVSDLAGADLTGGIWFTVGCHSGSSVADVSVVGAPSEDWAQTFSRAGALFLAQNAYGLGDTEAVALTERLMANFARNLNGHLTIGQAHAFAKQQYFGDLGLYGEYDFKALQAATLFGLPMYQYGLAVPPPEPPEPALPVAADPLSGLPSASWSLSNTGIQQSSTGKGELFSVDGEVQFVHFRPLQPIVRRDVTGPNGEVAGGAFLTTLVTEDKAIADIAFARPVIDLGENETEIESDEVVFPTAFTNIATFNAPSPSGGPFEPRQQLNVIVGQFTSPPGGGSSGTERLFRSFDAQVFYRQAPAAGSGASAAAFGGGGAGTVDEDYLRPELDNVQATVVGPAGARQAAFSVDANDEGTVVRVAVLYLQSVSNDPEIADSPELSNWVLVDLVQNSGTNTWTGGGPVDLSGIADGQIDYMVQALDANGNVANSTFKGLFYFAEEAPPPPEPDQGPGNIGVVVSVGDTEVDPETWITTDPVDIEITDQAPLVTYEYSVDFAPFVPLTSGGFQIAEDGVHTVTVRESDGSNPVTFVVLIDTTPPQAEIITPSEGEFVVQGQAPAADFDCIDAGSGIESCVGTVANGSPVPSASIGEHTFAVSAQDDAHFAPTVVQNTYFVVKPLQVSGPTEPGAIADPVTVTASATDLAGFEETVTIDWGDGGPAEAIDLAGGSVGSVSAEHVYPVPGFYEITVTVDYEGHHSQVGTVEFVTVYDPDGSSVSGKGKFDSPPGAYTPGDNGDEDMTGKADFDFKLEYKFKKPKKGKGKDKGPVTPGYWELDGKTKFHFHDAGIKFDARVHDFMVIEGAHAVIQGETRVKDREELYKFQITAIDANIPESGISMDNFRIRIWHVDADDNEIVLYDNGVGTNDPAGTPVDDKSIKIKEPKKRK